MQPGGNLHWYLMVGALALAGAYTLAQIQRPEPAPEPPAAAVPAASPPAATPAPARAPEAELLPAELTLIESEQMRRKLEQEQEQPQMMMDNTPESKD